MSAPDVWVARQDGSDIVRAARIAAVSRDYQGNITVRLSGAEQAVVTLVHDDDHDARTPDDFHRQLMRVIAGLSYTAEPAVVRPVHDPDRGWQWLTEHL